ncbi:MAG: universal stress protein [Hyphomicrobiales bacterium]|uniref:universal stress protein n=1 Tax=Rhabdaerophilum calidifontis TaxID=2604328 RepID=UPI0012387973|nr:universal stress protein [Rhabdaerophilum calidifontis]MCA1999732.1 universal stress protein [Hyphomicrobiales bacterium]
MFKKLLVPVDLSDMKLSKVALDKARALAESWGAELRLVNVMPIVPSTYLEYVPVGFEAGEKARVEAEMQAIADGLGLPAGRATIAVRSGGVYHEVLAEAEASKADLIVCGSHWPTLATYLIGSHATNIVRHANCSVLVVRGEGS